MTKKDQVLIIAKWLRHWFIILAIDIDEIKMSFIALYELKVVLKRLVTVLVQWLVDNQSALMTVKREKNSWLNDKSSLMDSRRRCWTANVP